MNQTELEACYQEHLEEDIILCLSQKENISLEYAMKIYYSSNIAQKIHDGLYGVQYLDYHILVDWIIEELHTEEQ